jgi:exopolyphosphatase/guanosine-5'-triphosphate,3'-diphosphate pyrophosphatase
MQFAGLVRRETGFDLEVLSGEDEAHWTYRGAISGITALRQATVVDIGGGSTEITLGDRHTILRRVSLNVGSVRLTERFFRSDPPKPSELEGALEEVRKELAKVRDFEFEGSTLIGVAGTATSLAILNQGLPEFAVQAVSGYPLNRAAVDALYRRLCTMPSMEIRSLSTVMEGRSDVITAGSLILREIMNRCGFKELVVSERGVRYGMAIREWEKRTVL